MTADGTARFDAAPALDPSTAPPSVGAGAPTPTAGPGRPDADGPDRRTSTGDRARRLLAGTLRWVAAIGGALLIYSAFLILKGASPTEVLTAMVDAAFGDARSVGDTLLRATPLLLAALAVAVPARAGLFNIGGEGQLVLGAVGAAGMAYALGGSTSGPLALVLLALAGAGAGALWALIPAVLKVATRTNEAITSLLLNYVATIVLTWLVFEPWKDPRSTGQAYSREIAPDDRLPILWGNRVNIGIVVAVVAAVVVWLLFRSTRWGFKLKVLGGNPEAARRAGFAVGGLAIGAMAVGGALAGLGGMIEVTGLESRLRPGIMVGFGYMGFLASWLARHHPLKAIAAALLLAAIAVGGNGLKVAAGLSGAAVNVLMALLLLAVLGWAQRRPNAGGPMIEAVLTGAVAGGTSILFPTLGEITAERSGVINLGTEGSMLCGALAAYAVGIETGNAWLGVLAGLVAGAAMAGIHAFVVLRRGANQIATGLVVTFLALGITALFGQPYVGQGVVALEPWPVPGLSSLPFLGPVLFDHDPLTYLSLLAVPALWWVLFRSKAGLRLRAAGERPDVLRTFGGSPDAQRALAVVAGGALAGLGGAQLATAFTLNWSEGMTAGLGFVAVALVIFAAWDPRKAIIGAYLFSGTIALQLQLQAQGSDISRYLLQALPYLVVIVSLALLAGRRLHAAPEALSRVFDGSA